jgi:hypothetical protein
MRRRQRGIAAVELAAIVSTTFFVAPVVVVLCLLTLEYSVLQKSVYHAARYLGTLPAAEMSTAALSAQAIVAARQMVFDTASDGGATVLPDPAAVLVLCNGNRSCINTTLPQSVTLSVTVDVGLSQFYTLLGGILPNGSMSITVQATVPYGD